MKSQTENPKAPADRPRVAGPRVFTGFTPEERLLVDDSLAAFKTWWFAYPGTGDDTKARKNLVDLIEILARMAAD